MDTDARLTAAAAMDHRWFDSASERPLPDVAAASLRKYTARRRLKATMGKVRMGVRLGKRAAESRRRAVRNRQIAAERHAAELNELF